MNKHSMAIAFALIGFGISGFIAGFTFTSILLGLCIGGFIGYFISGLSTAKGTILQENFVSLGNLVGLSLDEIKSKVGNYSAMSSCTVADTGKPGALYTWTETPYSITLLFDENNKCLGVNKEITK